LNILFFAAALSERVPTLASAAHFHFPDFNQDCQSLNIYGAKWDRLFVAQASACGANSCKAQIQQAEACATKT
jgi:hypothetical protein